MKSQMQKATRSGNFDNFNISRLSIPYFMQYFLAFYQCSVSINTKNNIWISIVTIRTELARIWIWIFWIQCIDKCVVKKILK